MDRTTSSSTTATGPIFCCSSALPVSPPYTQKGHGKSKRHRDPNREVHEAIFHSFMEFAVRRDGEAMLLAEAGTVMRGLDRGRCREGLLTPPESRAVTPVGGLRLRLGSRSMSRVLAPVSMSISMCEIVLREGLVGAQMPVQASRQMSTSGPVSTSGPARVSIPAQKSAQTLTPPQTAAQILTPSQTPTPTIKQKQTPTHSHPPPPPVLTPAALTNNPLTPQTAYVLQLTSRRDFGPVYSHRYFACPASLQHDWPEISLEQWFAAGQPFGLRADQRDLKCVRDGRFFRLVLRPNLGMRGFDEGDGSSGEEGRWRRNWWQ